MVAQHNLLGGLLAWLLLSSMTPACRPMSKVMATPAGAAKSPPVTSGPARHEGPGSGIEWSPSIGLKKLAGVEAALTMAHDDEFTLVDPTDEARQETGRSCRDYIQLRARGFESATQLDHNMLRPFAAGCRILEALMGARSARRDYLAGVKLTPSARHLLPPTLALGFSGEAQAAATAAHERGESWQDFQPRATVEQRGNQLVVRDQTTEVILEIVARGDFNGDGVQDLILQTDDAATEGSFRDTRLFLFTRRSLGGPLELVKQVLL